MAAAGEKKKLLLIDDDETHLSIAENILKSEYETVTVKSGKEALDSLWSGYRPEIILLDISLPTMDGWDTYNKIKEISTQYVIPMAFLISESEKSSLNDSPRIGVSDYILKPFIREDLLFRVKTIIENSENNGRR